MNAAGISVFYGAMDEDTCIAEARAPVGSDVVIGRFEIIRPVRLLDLDTLKDVYVKGSHFDANYHIRRGQAAFLGRLVWEMSRPVMPRDQEFDYLPTQAVSEYLASCVEPPLDGIVFHSSQAAGEGRNLVLFNRARRVEPYDLPRGTEFDFLMGRETEDDYDDSIVLFETIPAQKPESVNKNQGFDPLIVAMRSYWDVEKVYQLEREEGDGSLECRHPTLRLDIKSIRVLRIEAVRYEHRARRVSRHRRTKGEPEDF
jgi:hypothetical protein